MILNRKDYYLQEGIMKKITYILIMIGALMIVLAACSSASSTDKKSEKLTINTTVFPLKSFTEQIGGKHVEVKSIYPAGTDLHSYEPTQKDLMEATKADLFIYLYWGRLRPCC